MNVIKTDKGIIINGKIISDRNDFLNLDEEEKYYVIKFRKQMFNSKIKDYDRKTTYRK